MKTPNVINKFLIAVPRAELAEAIHAQGWNEACRSWTAWSGELREALHASDNEDLIESAKALWHDAIQEPKISEDEWNKRIKRELEYAEQKWGDDLLAAMQAPTKQHPIDYAAKIAERNRQLEAQVNWLTEGHREKSSRIEYQSQVILQLSDEISKLKESSKKAKAELNLTINLLADSSRITSQISNAHNETIASLRFRIRELEDERDMLRKRQDTTDTLREYLGF
jgi:polyhydroxyalkanoate synthesis regulator phasin